MTITWENTSQNGYYELQYKLEESQIWGDSIFTSNNYYDLNIDYQKYYSFRVRSICYNTPSNWKYLYNYYVDCNSFHINNKCIELNGELFTFNLN